MRVRLRRGAGGAWRRLLRAHQLGVPPMRLRHADRDLHGSRARPRARCNECTRRRLARGARCGNQRTARAHSSAGCETFFSLTCLTFELTWKYSRLNDAPLHTRASRTHAHTAHALPGVGRNMYGRSSAELSIRVQVGLSRRGGGRARTLRLGLLLLLYRGVVDLDRVRVRVRGSG